MRRAIDFFNRVAEEADNPQAREIFIKIGQEEEYHYALLQAQFDYLSKSGFWFDIGEFRMDAKY